MTFDELQAQLQDFAGERGWTKYHTPRNLALALGGEVGELMEILQWRTDAEVAAFAETEEGRSALGDELADITIYVSQLASALGFGLGSCVEKKMQRNAHRFPPEV